MTRRSRRLVLHIGTPKTGTTTLQIVFGDRTRELAERGILVPMATRGATPIVGAHREIVPSLLAPDTASNGQRIADLLAELERSSMPTAIVSSEALCALYRVPGVLASFASELAAIGYETVVVLYVREQSAFAESVYAEYAKQGAAWDADAYVDAVVERDPRTATADEWTFAFDYTIVIDHFSDVFGSTNVRVRPYLPATNGNAMLGDFWDAIGVGRDDGIRSFRDDRRHNPRSTFPDVLRRLRANSSELPERAPDVVEILQGAGISEASVRDAPFAMLDASDIARIETRFARVNRRIFEDHGVALQREPRPVPATSISNYKRALAAATRAWKLRRSF